MIGIERFIRSFSTINEADLDHYKPDFVSAVKDYRNKRLPFYLQETIFESVGERLYLGKTDLSRTYKLINDLISTRRARDLEIAKFFLHGYFRMYLEDKNDPEKVKRDPELRFNISSERYQLVREYLLRASGKEVPVTTHVPEQTRSLQLVPIRRGMALVSEKSRERVEQAA